MAFSLLKTSQVTLLCLMILQATLGAAFPQQRRSPVRNSGFVRLTREDVAAPATGVYEEGVATEAPGADEVFIPLGEIPLEGELPASFDENFSDEDAVATEAPSQVIEDAPAEPEDVAAPLEDAPVLVEDAPAVVEDAVEDTEALRITSAVAEAVVVQEPEEPEEPAAEEIQAAEEAEIADEPQVAQEVAQEVAEEVVQQVAQAPAAEEEQAPEETPVPEETPEDAAPVQEDAAVAEVEPASVPDVPVAPPAKTQQKPQKPQKQTLYNVLPPLYGILYPLKPTGTPAIKAGYAAVPPAKSVPATTARPLYPPPAAYRPVFPVTNEFDPPSPTSRPSKTVKPAADAPVTNYPRHAFGVPPTPRGLGFPTIQNTRDNLRFDVNWGEVGRRQRSAASKSARSL